MAEFLGALRRIGVFTRNETHLMIYDDSLVVASSTDAAVVLGAAIGLGLANTIAERIARKGETRSPEQIAEEAPQNRVIPNASIESATIRKIAKGLYRELELTLAGDIHEIIRWQRGDNPDELSLALLRAALGERLTVEWDDQVPSVSKKPTKASKKAVKTE